MKSQDIKQDYQDNDLDLLADDLESLAHQPARIGGVSLDVPSGRIMEITNQIGCIKDLIADNDADGADLDDLEDLQSMHASGARYAVLDLKRSQYRPATRDDYRHAIRTLSQPKTNI